MKGRRSWFIAVVLVLMGTGFFASSRRSAPAFAPNFGIGFHGYTNGWMGKRMAIVSITNLCHQSVRVWPAPQVDYGPPFNGAMQSGFLQEMVLAPHRSFTGVVEVITDPGPHRPKWRLIIQASRAMPSERFRRWWEKSAATDSWLRFIPVCFYSQPEATFISEWLGP